MQLNPGNTNGVEMLQKLGVDFNPEEMAVKLSPKEQNAFVGEYDVDHGGILKIQIVDGKLEASHPAIPTQTMLYYSDNLFLLVPQKFPMKFTLDDQDKPERFEVQMGIGRKATGTKKD